MAEELVLKGPEITFQHVVKEYRTGTRALDGLDFNVGAGKFAYLMGHSGSGKSSLIKLLMMEEVPDEGIITVGGIDLSKVKKNGVPEYRRNIGVVFQDFRLIKTMTVFDNIALALEIRGVNRKKIKQQVESALRIVDLPHKKNQMPDDLSGGEQQRVAIARAVVNLPGLIIADEPTGNLDPANSLEIIKILEKINDMGATVIVATHDVNVVKDRPKDSIIRLDHGVRIREEE